MILANFFKISFIARSRRIGVVLIGLPLLLIGCARGQVADPADFRVPVDPQQTVALATSPTLHLAISLALERNPGIKAARLEWLAAIHREPQAYTPEDPMVNELGYDFTMNGWARVMPEVPVPWPQKLWQRGKIAALDADIARINYEARTRDILIEVKNAWYELYYLDQAQTITQQIEMLMKNQGILAYAGLERGRTQLNEAFRAESQAAQLGYDRILLFEQRVAQAERLRALINLPPEIQIGPVRHAPVYAVSESIEPLYERAENYSSVLKIRGLETVRARRETSLARLARLPDPVLGLEITGLSAPENNYMGMFSANLPIYEWKNRAMVLEKKAMEEAAREMARDERNMTRAAVAETYYGVRLTGRLMDLYRLTLLPQAESIMRQAEINFRGEQAAISSVLETTIAYHNFLLAYHRGVADHGQAVGRLEQAIGATAEPRESLPEAAP